MPGCIHELGAALRKQQKLAHPDPVENQIEIASRIKPLELFQWTAGYFEPLGPIQEETLIFLFQQSHLAGEASNVINDIALIVNEKVQKSTAMRFRRFISVERIEDFCARVTETFWGRVLDPTDTTAHWAQISFWPFVFGLARDLLKKERFENELFVSLEADRPRKEAYAVTTLDPLYLDNEMLVRELLGFLTLAQKRVFVSRHYHGLTLPEIALKAHCTERTVHNLLKAAENRLRQVIG